MKCLTSGVMALGPEPPPSSIDFSNDLICFPLQAANNGADLFPAIRPINKTGEGFGRIGAIQKLNR